MRDFFHSRLEEYKEYFIHMGAFVEDQYAMAVEALAKRNITLSKTIIDREKRSINCIRWRAGLELV